MNSYIIESMVIHKNFHIDIVDIRFSKSMDQLQKFSFSKVFTTLKYGYIIVKKMVSCKFQIVYFTLTPTGFGFYRDSFYVFLLKFFKTKIILHLHGKGIKQNANNYFKKKLYKWVFNKTYVICLTKNLSNDITGIYKPVPFIVPNGIKVQKFCITQRTIQNREVPQILFLSNFMKNKGILVLIEALGILKDQGYKFTARFVGAPFDLSKEMIEDVIRNNNLAPFAKVIGPLMGAQKFLEYEMADIFVFPTLSEAFGLVNLEAMQFALPVISTFEGSIPDIVINNETGFLVETQNTQMLADKIGVLLKDRNKRIEMGMKGYERFINNYTIDHFIANINKTFQDILISR